jgi:hypothetical protein
MHFSQGVKARSLHPCHAQRVNDPNLTHRPHPSPSHSSLTHALPAPPSHPKAVAQRVNDPNLKLVLSFGIGMHHAGLREGDRKIVEELFTNRKIQILVATSTLAWGINMPAHLGQSVATPFRVSVMMLSYVPFPHFACRVVGVCVGGGGGGLYSVLFLMAGSVDEVTSGDCRCSMCATALQLACTTTGMRVACCCDSYLSTFMLAVVIKGTEYFDGKTKRYVDFPITDVMQMMGRAGRPQFDTQACAPFHVTSRHFACNYAHAHAHTCTHARHSRSFALFYAQSIVEVWRGFFFLLSLLTHYPPPPSYTHTAVTAAAAAHVWVYVRSEHAALVRLWPLCSCTTRRSISTRSLCSSRSLSSRVWGTCCQTTSTLRLLVGQSSRSKMLWTISRGRTSLLCSGSPHPPTHPPTRPSPEYHHRIGAPYWLP